MSFNILNIGEQIYNDDSIVSCELHTHPPYSNTTFNNSDEIRIPIQTQDIYTLPSQSYLYIEGTLLDTAQNKRNKNVDFVNNGVAHLFDEIRYEIGGTVVDRVRNPGITTTMKGYASFATNECIRYQAAGWSTSTVKADIVDDNGNFNVYIPLKILLGFCEDFRKILINIRQELVLIRSSSDLNAIHSSKQDDDKTTKIELQKVLWKMPHVKVSDAEKLRLLTFLDSGEDLQLAFRSWELNELPVLQQTMKHTWNVKSTNQLEKPRYVIVAFQTGRKNAITRYMSQFDHCNLTNIKLYLNSEMYPYDNLNLNFDKSHYAVLYDMFAKFQESYYYKQNGEPILSPDDFVKLVPLFIIDCSQQNESLKSGSVDIRLEFETNKNVLSNTTAYCLIIHDRIVQYNPQTNTVKV